MPDTFKHTKDSTYTDAGGIKYSSAKFGSSHIPEKTYQYDAKILSVPTSRTYGEIKLRIAPREMPEPKNISSTK
jgi:hypothetical protein